jgi:hypothetical protein
MPLFKTAKDEKIESSFPALEPPDLNSSIPPYLLEGSTPAMVYLLQEQSKQSRFNEWAIPALMEISQQTRKTNGRLLVVEKWKDKVTSIWGLAIGAIVVVYTTIHGLAELWYYLKN